MHVADEGIALCIRQQRLGRAAQIQIEFVHQVTCVLGHHTLTERLHGM